MYIQLFIVILNASSCFCYAGYELFQGFDETNVDDTSETFLHSIYDSESKTSPVTQPTTQPTNQPTQQTQQNTTTPKLLQNENTTQTTLTDPSLTTKSKFNESVEVSSVNNTEALLETNTLRSTKFDCPEDERPYNIGPYEIPTQRDLVLFTKNMLIDMFNSYSKEAFYLLKDIRVATKATSSIEKKCEGNKLAYRLCVKLVSRQCEQITKNLVKALENKKQNVSDLAEVRICNLSHMKTDPIEILKSLAQEQVSIQFALPGFLRLLNACSINCIPLSSPSNYDKPMRHMTDQDLVIKHFLTRKNYLELIMDSRHKSKANSN